MFWISVISQYYMTILKTKQGPKSSKFTEALKTCAFDTELFYILKFAKSVTYLNMYVYFDILDPMHVINTTL